MTDNQPDNIAPDGAGDNIGAAVFSVGTALREARERQGLSVDEISSRIKFAPRQIEALESDDFAHLPETTFLRGFVRSYARLVQLDDVPLLAALPHGPEQSMTLEAKALTEVPYPDIYTERKHNIIWLSAALAVAVVLGLSAWLLGDKQKETNTQMTAGSGTQNVMVETLATPAALPVSAVPDAEPVTVVAPVAEKLGAEKTGTEMKKAAEANSVPQSAPLPVKPVAVPLASQAVKPVAENNASGHAAIRMTFGEDSWVDITDKDGKHLLSQLNHAGSEQSVDGSPPFTLTIGYTKGVHLYYKGKAVDLAPYSKADVAHLTLE